MSRQTTRIRYAGGGCLALTALVMAQIVTLSPAGGVATGTALTRSTLAPKVCGGLLADATFTEEASLIGVEHACEHLRGRKSGSGGPAGHHLAHQQLQDVRQARTAALAATDPAVIGSWSAAANPGTKTIGISAVLLHTGKVLLFGGKYASTDKNTAAYLYDPVSKTGHEVPAPAAVFCGSITQLSDGRVLSAGGALPVPKGIVDLWLFDPVSEQWLRQPDSPLGRYYPTSTRLADGRVVVAAGTQLDGRTANPTVEVYTPPAAGAVMGGLDVVGPSHVTRYYPRQWVMPDGKLLQVDNVKAYQLDPETWNWSALQSLPGGNGAGSAGLMLPAGPGGSTKVLMIGGLKKGVSTPSTERYDYANPTAGWSYARAMPTGRSHMNVVQVPDGSAFVIGGNSSKQFDGPQHQTLKYDPAGDTWTPMAVQGPRRGYHSTAVLLPDGRIMSAGDTGPGGGRQLIDYYSPPYLFQGPRPVIASAPTQVSYGQNFTIETSGPEATRAVLMAPAATTHANEMNARHVELAVAPAGTSLAATAPTSQIAPPGHYMLFTLTAGGVPSTASWVHVGP